MRYATYAKPDSGSGVGLIVGDKLVEAATSTWPRTMLQLIRGAGTIDRSHSTEAGIALAGVKLQAPIPVPPKNIFCIGRNYTDHINEVAATRSFKEYTPEYPVFFTKPYTTIIGPEDEIMIDSKFSTEIDWEAELAVIIGVGGRHIEEKDALKHVFGYTCANDVTARDAQKNHEQWFLGKSFDTSCPLGPWIVTPDEIGDPQNLDIQLRVNGEVKQHANTSQMIFSIAQQIAWLSKSITLEPGDIISTGTPSGVGFARKPPEFLKAGDIVEVEIQYIGILRNKVAQLKAK